MVVVVVVHLNIVIQDDNVTAVRLKSYQGIRWPYLTANNEY